MNENIKRIAAIEIVRKYRDDKFLVFVHTKKTGYLLQETLQQQGIVSEFHNADVSKENRERIEKEFRSRDKDSLRVIIATSTLAMGLNLPARRVVLVGLTRGINLITSMEINQMVGRAGRIGLDPCGDAHILIDNMDAVEEIGLCKKIEPITSKLGERKIFGFHIISEIAEKNISTIEDALKWYLRSLLHHQSIFESEDVAKNFILTTLDELEKYGAIKRSVNGYVTTKIGLVASWYYLSPYDVVGWASNFKSIMSEDFRSEDIAWALANIDSCLSDYSTKIFDINYSKFEIYLQGKGRLLNGGVGKKAFAYFCILKNMTVEQREMYSIVAGTKMDMERISSAIKTLGNASKMFEDCPNKHLVLELPYRLRYGLDNVELVLIPGVGSVTAKKMMGRRIFTCKELLMAQEMGQKVLTDEKWVKVKDVVKQIANIGYINYLKYEDK
jgi:replicative superfamily II helicase